MTTEYAKPLPAPSELTQPYWDATKRHELVIQRCKACAKYFFYPRELCPNCHSLSYEWAPISGRGRVYSFTSPRDPAHPAFRESIPYIYAIIQLEEGPRMISNIIDCPFEECQVDMPVQAVFDDVADDITLVKFRRV